MHPPTDVVPLTGEPDGCDPVVARLRGLVAAPVAPSVAAAHLGAIERQGSTRARRRRAAVAGLVAAGLFLGSTSLAAAGVLPAPAQTAMSTTLRRLGIDVPATQRAAGADRARRGDAPAGRAIAERTGDGGADRLHRDRPARPRPNARADVERAASAVAPATRAAGSGGTPGGAAAGPGSSTPAPPTSPAPPAGPGPAGEPPTAPSDTPTAGGTSGLSGQSGPSGGATAGGDPGAPPAPAGPSGDGGSSSSPASSPSSPGALSSPAGAP